MKKSNSHLELPCKLYRGYKDKNGYGYRSQRKNGERFIHRQVFLDTYGYLPEVVRHICDNPACIESTHLLGGTQADNMRDMKCRNRRKGIAAVKGETHGMHKLTANKVLQIRDKYVPRKYTVKRLAKEYGGTARTIKAVVEGQSWKHLL